MPKYKPRHRLLLSLIARRTDMLDEKQLSIAAYSVASNHKQHVATLEFLKTIKAAKRPCGEYFPTTMIVDELVDYAFWEMVWPTQEFNRIGSITTLFNLFDKYKHQIEGGYVRVNVDKGLMLCNPGKFYLCIRLLLN